MGRIWAIHRGLCVIFLLALGLTGIYAVRAVDHALYWADPANIRRTPEDWMTPGYLARSWNMDRATLVEALELPPALADRRKIRLRDIARARGVPTEVLLADLQRQLLRDAPAPAPGGAASDPGAAPPASPSQTRLPATTLPATLQPPAAITPVDPAHVAPDSPASLPERRG